LKFTICKSSPVNNAEQVKNLLGREDTFFVCDDLFNEEEPLWFHLEAEGWGCLREIMAFVLWKKMFYNE